jgi:hypothetical protein
VLTRARPRLRAPARSTLPLLVATLRGILPLGKTRKDWNFSLQDKRVLNFENEVSDSDNVKQARSRTRVVARGAPRLRTGTAG